MEDTAAITFRLESYLVQLSDINRRWQGWLHRLERAIIGGDSEQLQTLAPRAGALMGELQESLAARNSLLEDARAAGLAAGDLTGLARRLPAWRRGSLRQSIEQTRQQLRELQRLHMAAWVLISYSWQVVSGSLQLMHVGQSERAVYAEPEHADRSGGQLLDEQL